MGGYCGGGSDTPSPDTVTTRRGDKKSRATIEDSFTQTATPDYNGVLCPVDSGVDDDEIDNLSDGTDSEDYDDDMKRSAVQSKAAAKTAAMVPQSTMDRLIEEDAEDPRNVIGQRPLTEVEIAALPQVTGILFTLAAFTQELVANPKLNDRQYLTDVWEDIDLNEEAILETEEVRDIIQRLVKDYVVLTGGNERTLEDRSKDMDMLTDQVFNQYLDAIEEYDDKKGKLTITKTHFLSIFVQYMEFPSPMLFALANAKDGDMEATSQPSVVVEESNPIALVTGGAAAFLGAVGVKSDAPKKASRDSLRVKERAMLAAQLSLHAGDYEHSEDMEALDTLTAISTSPTVRGLPDFSSAAQHKMCSDIQNILEGVAKSRAARVSRELVKMNSVQRAVIKKLYRSNDGLSLEKHLHSAITGKEQVLLSHLVMSPAEFEAMNLKQAIADNNTHVISDIICTRTNSQLADIKKAYKARFSEALLVDISNLKKGSDGYELLLFNLLTEMRPEEARESVNAALVLSDVLKLTATFSGKVVPQSLIAHLTQMSLPHLELVNYEFCRVRDYDLEYEVGRQVPGRVGHALKTMISVATDRPAYFAKLLRDAMKGAGVTDEQLMRQVITRCEIDLGDVVNAFNARFGEGKTLLQWITSDCKGVYASLLCQLCGFGTPSEEPMQALKHLDFTPFLGVSPSTRMPPPFREWSDYFVTAPTIVPNIGLYIIEDVQKLSDLVFDKSIKGKARKVEFKNLIVPTLCKMSNAQRQELQTTFEKLEANALKKTLREVCAETLGKKSKAWSIILPLLMSPEEFDCTLIKKKNLALVIEVLATRTNAQIRKIQAFWNANEKSDFLGELQKMSAKKKGTNSLIMALAKAEREETAQFSVERVLESVRTIATGLKDTEYLMQFLAKSSFVHISSVTKVWNAIHRIGFEPTLQKALGSTTGTAAVQILGMANDRFGLWAEHLRVAMAGVGVDLAHLTRTCVSRSESDLDGAAKVFSVRSEFSGNKTLSQWIDDDTGSLNTYNSAVRLLLDIANVETDAASGALSPSVSLTANEERVERARMQTFSLMQPGSTVDTLDGRLEAFTEDGSEEDAFEEKEDIELVKQSSSAPFAASLTDDLNAEAERMASERDLRFVEAQSSDSALTASTPSMSAKVVIAYTGTIPLKKLGNFVSKKVTGPVLDKIWKSMHLDNASVLTKDELQKVLIYTCVIYLHVLAKKEPETPRLDKKQAGAMINPVVDWMIECKMPLKATIAKGEFTSTIGAWLSEASVIVDSA